MNNNKKIIAIQAVLIFAMVLIGSPAAYASEVTGTLSSSASASSGSQAGGGIGGSVTGGSSVSGTLGGGSGGGISGTVGGGGGGGGGGSALAGTVSAGGGGGGNILPAGQVLGASTVAPTPGLPNTGADSHNQTNALVNLSLLIMSVLVSMFSISIFKRKRI